MEPSSSGRVGGARGRPSVRGGIISPAGVQINKVLAADQAGAASDDHFAAAPDGTV